MRAAILPRSLYSPLLMITLAVGMALGAAAPYRAAASGAVQRYRPGEIVVRLASASLTIDDVNRDLGTSTAAQMEGDAGVYLLRTPPGSDPSVVSDALALDPRLDFAEPNYINGAPVANPRGIGAWGGTDPAPLLAQSALAQIGLTDARALSRGTGVTVAIIDTGAQLDHPDLAASIAPDSYDFVDDDSSPIDTPDGIDNNGDGVADEAYGHGTHLAGIIHTLAPDARLLVLRALTAEGDGDMFNLVRAIDYAVAHGATVINMSLGTSEDSRLLRAAVRRATLGGAVVIAAAGNTGTDLPQYPAATSCAIAVTSVDSRDVRSTFASYGAWVSVAAPGEGIFSAFPASGYATWSGTSMATAFVSGQAALILSLQPTLNARDVGDLIGGTAASVDLVNPDLPDLLGDGRIDLAASLRAASQNSDTRAHHRRITRSCVSDI
ncbi:MAG: S8 family serine peptidase [Chloroflexales bacterium]